MAYNKRTWATGNVVGAVDLNRMEGGIEENHPGYEYREEIITLWEGSVTTEGEEEEAYAIFPYTEQIVADKLCVTFNGTTYVCEKIVNGEDIIYGGYVYGNRDFSKYPFIISSGTDSYGIFNEIDTKTAGTYTLKIEADNSTITTNKGFQKAVKSVGDSGYECTTSFEEVFSESGVTEEPKDPDKPITATLSYTGFIDADEIKVVFNGTEYTCPKKAIADYAVYGSYSSSFTDYPFAIGFSQSQGNLLQTKDPINFTIEVDVPVITATVTPCFETAVKTAIGSVNGVKVVHIRGDSTSGFTCDTSCDEMEAIVKNGGYLVAYSDGFFYNLDNVPSDWVNSISVTKATPTLKAGVAPIEFSRVYIDESSSSPRVIKEKFVINSFNCKVTTSTEEYPPESN